ncbi:hypothetical protein FSP39_024374 [Pinctada imbricata]|uniref:Uncharacterized protein n=1 Tax=Pinctada imbricata TaxID=66713 RepID=A0AA89C5W8_PINIB|nr:hypothetical protein FSP39_024374 [Pinctada imbricata]
MIYLYSYILSTGSHCNLCFCLEYVQIYLRKYICISDDDDDESLNISSVSGDSISDVKLKIKRHVEDQTVAQAIVFALIQKQQSPNTNIFIPNILICDTKFYIVMYEPVRDILIWSGEFHLWDQSSPTTLNTTAVITLWMVIHYKLFCCGGEIFEDLSEVKAGFLDQISEEKKTFYEQLKFGVTNFETDTKELGFTSRSHQMSDSFILAKINI